MSNTLNQDLRKRVIAYWERTGHKSNTANTFNISRTTLDSWINLYKEQGNVKPKPTERTGVKPIITDLVAFEDYVKSQEFDTAKQLREQYLKDHPDINISYNAFVTTLHRINWSFKKRHSPLNKQTQ
ncbi:MULTISPECIES: helix-turn-helix domain-containing protein [unclassified Acinetobacter]|uniref:helix-turn-helix domain-containing protein n=1 Tax=unclassified Acinetobacter TaxID=196816 RepID=UPI0035BA76CB